MPTQRFALCHQGVEDAPPLAELSLLPCHFAGLSLQKHLGEHAGGTGLRRNHDPAAGVRLAGGTLAAENDGGKASDGAHLFRGKLINRNRIAKTVPTGVPSRTQPSHEGGMFTSTLIRMRETGEEGEVVAVILQELQILSGLVILPGLGWEQGRTMQAQRGTNKHHPLGRRWLAALRTQRFHPRQGEGDSGSPKKGAAIVQTSHGSICS